MSKVQGPTSQFRLWTLDRGTLDPRWDGTRCFTEKSPEKTAPSPPRPSPARGEGGRCGWGLGILGLRCAPTQAISCRAPLGLEKIGTAWDGTRCFIERIPADSTAVPNRLPPTDGGRAPARGGFVPPYGIADGRRGPLTPGPSPAAGRGEKSWDGTGHVVSPSVARGIWPSPIGSRRARGKTRQKGGSSGAPRAKGWVFRLVGQRLTSACPLPQIPNGQDDVYEVGAVGGRG